MQNKELIVNLKYLDCKLNLFYMNLKAYSKFKIFLESKCTSYYAKLKADNKVKMCLESKLQWLLCRIKQLTNIL